MSDSWQVLSREVLLDRAPWLRVWVERVRLPNGVVIDDYIRVAMRSWVAVFAVTSDGRVPLVEQYRAGIDAHTLELPAGYLEDSEPPEVCAQRELREEVGAVAGSFEALGSYTMIANRADMRMHVVLARGVKLVGEQQLEDTEDIFVHWLTLPELREKWRNGEIIPASHATAIARGLDALGVL